MGDDENIKMAEFKAIVERSITALHETHSGYDDEGGLTLHEWICALQAEIENDEEPTETW